MASTILTPSPSFTKLAVNSQVPSVLLRLLLTTCQEPIVLTVCDAESVAAFSSEHFVDVLNDDFMVYGDVADSFKAGLAIVQREHEGNIIFDLL